MGDIAAELLAKVVQGRASSTNRGEPVSQAETIQCGYFEVIAKSKLSSLEGEDPILAGTMTGTLEKGVLSEHVMTDIKHYALNDQETGRNVVNVLLDKKAMHESALLAFEIAIAIADPSGVMCSYNLVESDYACENDYLLNQVLKKDFAFKGFVLSDWGGTHSTVHAALSGPLSAHIDACTRSSN